MVLRDYTPTQRLLLQEFARNIETGAVGTQLAEVSSSRRSADSRYDDRESLRGERSYYQGDYERFERSRYLPRETDRFRERFASRQDLPMESSRLQSRVCKLYCLILACVVISLFV